MKIKSARVLGVVMTLMLVASLVVGIPLTASAGTQAWSSVTVPGAAGLVISNVEVQTTTVASDGTIYAAVKSLSANALGNAELLDSYSVVKSTDQGHTFSVTGLRSTATVTIPQIVAIKASPSAAGTVYVATATN